MSPRVDISLPYPHTRAEFATRFRAFEFRQFLAANLACENYENVRFPIRSLVLAVVLPTKQVLVVVLCIDSLAFAFVILFIYQFIYPGLLFIFPFATKTNCICTVSQHYKLQVRTTKHPTMFSVLKRSKSNEVSILILSLVCFCPFYD